MKSLLMFKMTESRNRYLLPTNVSLVLVNLVDKFTQTGVDHTNNEAAIDSSRTLSDPENFSNNNHVSQVIRKTADDTLALYERMISNQ